MSDAIAHWDDALDALAARLRAQAAFLAGDGPCPDGRWSPPEGPLPESCRVRAELLLAESRDLERASVAPRARVTIPAPSSPYR